MGIFDKLLHKAAPALIRTTSYGERYVVVKEGSYHRRERYIGGWEEIARSEESHVNQKRYGVRRTFIERSDTFVPAWVISSFLRKVRKIEEESIDAAGVREVVILTRGRNQYKFDVVFDHYGNNSERILWRLLAHPQRRQRRVER